MRKSSSNNIKNKKSKLEKLKTEAARIEEEIRDLEASPDPFHMLSKKDQEMIEEFAKLYKGVCVAEHNKPNDDGFEVSFVLRIAPPHNPFHLYPRIGSIKIIDTETNRFNLLNFINSKYINHSSRFHHLRNEVTGSIKHSFAYNNFGKKVDAFTKKYPLSQRKILPLYEAYINELSNQLDFINLDE